MGPGELQTGQEDRCGACGQDVPGEETTKNI